MISVAVGAAGAAGAVGAAGAAGASGATGMYVGCVVTTAGAAATMLACVCCGTLEVRRFISGLSPFPNTHRITLLRSECEVCIFFFSSFVNLESGCSGYNSL